jgi:hypothetical protein
VPEAERTAHRGVLLEHLRAFARREFDPKLLQVLGELHDHNLTTLEESRLMADVLAKSVWARRALAARAMLRGVASRLRVGPEETLVATR